MLPYKYSAVYTISMNLSIIGVTIIAALDFGNLIGLRRKILAEKFLEHGHMTFEKSNIKIYIHIRIHKNCLQALEF